MRRAKSVQSSSLIYFVANDNGAIKIGISTNLPARLNDLQVGSPTKLTLLGMLRGNEYEERETHRRFEHLRLEGEWFKDGPEIRDYIAGIMEVTEAMQATVAWHISNRVPLDRAGVVLGPFTP